MKKWFIFSLIIIVPLFIFGCSSNTIRVEQISLGWNHSSLLTSTGQIYTWGWNENGQLGDGTTTNRLSPNNITNQFNLDTNESIIQISLGYLHSTALTSTGRIFIWGDNEYGQLGDGTNTGKSSPVDITNQFDLDIDEMIYHISSGGYHVAVITSTGRIFIWGRNDDNQLGDGTTTNQSSPIDITHRFDLDTGEIIKSISLGNQHSVAFTSNKRIFTWGTQFQENADDDTRSDYNVPSPIDITSQFTLGIEETILDVTTGSAISAAISSTGRIFTWGWQFYGYDESGGIIDTIRTNPTNITNEFDLATEETITQITVESTHSFVTTSKGRIFAWGWNFTGQLGDGTSTNRSSPTEITKQFNLSKSEKIEMISLGESHALLITSKGRIFSWGWNFAGQLGDGTTKKVRNSPIEITQKFRS